MVRARKPIVLRDSRIYEVYTRARNRVSHAVKHQQYVSRSRDTIGWYSANEKRTPQRVELYERTTRPPPESTVHTQRVFSNKR